LSGDRWHVRGIALPGGGEPLDWWIAGGRLSSQPIDGAAELPGTWLAPGLVDAHAHLTFETRERLGLRRGSEELVAAHLTQQREAGVLAVRDAGSLPGVELPRRPAAAGEVIACGPFLAPAGLYLAQLYEPTAADEVIDCARQRVQAGAEWVKVIVDFPAADAGPLAPRLGYPLDLAAPSSRPSMPSAAAWRRTSWGRSCTRSSARRSTRSSTATGRPRRRCARWHIAGPRGRRR